MRLDGSLIAPESAQKQPGWLELGPQAQLSCYGETLIFHGVAQDVERMAVVGSMPTTLMFPDGWSFTLPHSREFNRWWATHHSADMVGKLEKTPWMILLSVVFTLWFCWAFFVYGFPAISSFIANNLPDAVYEHMGESTRQLLDENPALSASELHPHRQAALHSQFVALAARYPQVREMRLELGYWYGQENAFAIVDGTIVITDAMVRLLRDPVLIEAVMLHEIGHIAHEHSMKHLVEGSLLAFISAYVIGDVGALAETLVSVSVLAAMMHYSQADELAADAFAAEDLVEMRGSTAPMVRVLERLQALHREGDDPTTARNKHHHDDSSDPEGSVIGEHKDPEQASTRFKLPSWLSTHPELNERIAALQ